MPAVRATNLTWELSPEMTLLSWGGDLPTPVPGRAVVYVLCREAQICDSGPITQAVWNSFFVAATCPEPADHSLAVCSRSLGFSLLPCSEFTYLSLDKEPGSSRFLRTLYQMLPWLSCHSLGSTAKPLSDLAPTSHLPSVLRLFPALIVFGFLPPLTPPHLEKLSPSLWDCHMFLLASVF